MQNNKTMAIGVIVVGVVVGLVSLLADTLELGSNSDAFGTLQIVGLVVGIILIGGGAVFYTRVGPGE